MLSDCRTENVGIRKEEDEMRLDSWIQTSVEDCGHAQQINLSKIKLTTKLLTTDEVRSMQSSNSLRISSKLRFNY